MTVLSLGYQTDLSFARHDAEVIDRGGYTVVRTPSNPTFHWGNFLLFPSAPVEGDFERWCALSAQELPRMRHLAFGWDDPKGDIGEVDRFLNAGFRLDESVVLSTQTVHLPPKVCAEAEVRPLSQEWEWQAAVDNQVACRDAEYGEAGYREFAARQMDRRRAMAEVGLGRWFGAFVDGRLAGDLGVFVFDGVGRFQSVGTHPDFRRRGVCGTLVHAAARFAFDDLKAETLVMVADVHYHAARIYESVGFAPTERQVGLTWWER